MMQFQRATRQAVRLKLAIAGPSGSGKTLGALALAKTLAGDGRVALIDTENGSASLYGDKYEFDVLDLAPPFTSARYIEAMTAAVDAGYSVLVIDSLSHQWSGDGGILSRKEEMDRRPGSNSYTNWATFTKEHTAFVAKLLHLPVHIVATMRSKQDYILETNERGKQTPRKVGMAPVQREGLEYEFSAVFDVGMDHRATASKDRTGLFGDEPVDLVKASVGKKLLAWLASGAPAVEPSAASKPWEAYRVGDRAMSELTDDELRRYVEARSGEPKYVARVIAAQALLDERKTTMSADDAVQKMQQDEDAFQSSLP